MKDSLSSVCRLRLNVGNIQFSSENHDTKPVEGMFLTLAINESRSIEPSVYSIQRWVANGRPIRCGSRRWLCKKSADSVTDDRAWGVGGCLLQLLLLIFVSLVFFFNFFPENSSATRLLSPLRRLMGAKKTCSFLSVKEYK